MTLTVSLCALAGERRIRVHTLCLPVVNSLSDIFAGADVQAITALLASMGTALISYNTPDLMCDVMCLE